MMMKAPQASKINWIALAILILSFLQDPKFIELVPQEVGLWIFRIAALLIIVIRTIFTQVACPPPAVNPTVEDIHNMPVDAVVKEALHKVGHGSDHFTGKVEP